MRPRDSFAGRVEAVGKVGRLAAVAACASLVGCDVGNPTPDPVVSPAELARAKFEKAGWASLDRCLQCHKATPTIDFLAPGTMAEAYTSLFEFQPPVLNLEAPSSSLLLTMGQHRGPALTPEESTALLGWLEAERTARVPEAEQPMAVGPIQPQLNTMVSADLGFPGAQIRVTAAPFDGLYFSKIDLVAGPAGLHVVHPLFVSKPAGGDIVLDDLDRYRDLDLDLDPGETVELGASAFLPFAATDPLTIYFRTLEAR